MKAASQKTNVTNLKSAHVHICTLSRGNRSIHLSFDVDAIDPELLPCTGCPGKENSNEADHWPMVKI